MLEKNLFKIKLKLLENQIRLSIYRQLFDFTQYKELNKVRFTKIIVFLNFICYKFRLQSNLQDCLSFYFYIL